MIQTACASCQDLYITGRLYCVHCGRPLAPRPSRAQKQMRAAAAVTEPAEIWLDRLAESDCILIHTQNSLYRFTLIEPACRYGLLSGGPLGSGKVTALLLGAPHNGGNPLVLQIGSSVIFHVDSAEGVRRVETSAITGLTYIRGGGRTKPELPAPEEIGWGGGQAVARP
ncbi:MAG TPA: hypothetical protein VNO70_23595 [Blastocatellia bacterium]|nr:hypothetical protein [Blastocatellia bacterium]